MELLGKDTGRSFWPRYLLTLEVERRQEVFINIMHLNDLSLMEGDIGWTPKTVEEWKLLLHLTEQGHEDNLQGVTQPEPQRQAFPHHCGECGTPVSQGCGPRSHLNTAAGMWAGP